jgi:hypothetical protein
MAKEFTFTSESVSEGHPNKLCDRISDEVVDAFFRHGAECGWEAQHVRVACETMATTNRVVIAGETRGPATLTNDLVAHIASISASTARSMRAPPPKTISAASLTRMADFPGSGPISRPICARRSPYESQAWSCCETGDGAA